jgi:hypothetical protein
MLVAISFMDIQKYQSNEYFERNQAIYILHTMDKKPFEVISEEFKLAIEEIKKIIETHEKYENFLLGVPK